MTLTWAKRGDVIEIANEVSGTVEPTMVMSRCAALHTGYYCASCRRHLANFGNLILHTEDSEPGEVHHVAAWCSRCRLYEAPDQSQVDAFAAVTPTEAGQ